MEPIGHPGQPDSPASRRLPDTSAAGRRDDAHPAQSENPLGGQFPFKLSVQEIEVKMVDASSLAEYEIWVFFASLLSTAVVGFAVAYAQSFDGTAKADGQPIYLIVSIVFLMFFAGAIARVWFIRKNIRQRSVSHPMKGMRTED